MQITATQFAPAYHEMDVDTPVMIPAEHVVRTIAPDADLGIGRTIIFMRDGTTINVVETKEEIDCMLSEAMKQYFEWGVGRN